MRATEEPAITFGASAIGGLVIGTLTFFFHRAITRGDKEKDEVRKRLDDLREFVGEQKRENAAIWRNVEESKSDIKKLQDRFYDSKK